MLAGVAGCRTPSDRKPSASASVTTVQQPVRGTVSVSTSDGAKPLGPPELDLPADRLDEHVNGAAPWLQSIGCRRLLFWRVAQPPAELEVFVFSTDAGAQQALDKDSGGDRTRAVPGDEGWTNHQVVYFRRGTVYCRLIAESAVPNNGLTDFARRIDRAIVARELFH